MRRAWTLVTGLLFVVPLVGAWRTAPPSAAGTLVLALFAAATLIRPTWGLLGMCGLFPLAVPLSIATGSPQLTEELALTFLVTACARLAWVRPDPPGRLAPPALLMAVVVAGSGVLALSDFQIRTTTEAAPFLRELWHYVSAAYFLNRPYDRTVHEVVTWLEALALAVVAERILRRHTDAQPAAVRLLILSGGALALFSGFRLIELAVSSDHPWPTLVRVLWRSRFNPFYLDVNAAASLYALFLAPVLWLAWQRRSAVSTSAAAALLLAIWLAGSRAALAAVTASLGLAWMLVRRPSRRAVLAVSAAAVAAMLLVSATSARNSSIRAAASVRLELTRIAFSLTASHPVFGVGLGTFRERSAPLVREPLRKRYRVFFAEGENAHNNFLQILAELGIVGATAFLWMTMPVVVGGARRTWRGVQPSAGIALSAGVTAFLFSCLLGHPLLLADLRSQFFFVLGAATAIATSSVSVSAARWRAVAAALTLFALAALPFRLHEARASVDLAGAVFGASAPSDAEGTVHRIVTDRGTWFLGADTRAVELAVATAPDSDLPCRAAISLDGRPAWNGDIAPGVWNPVRFVMLPDSPVAHRHLDVIVEGDGCRLMVSTPVERR